MTNNRVIDKIVAPDAATKRWRMKFAMARLAYESGELTRARQLLERALEMGRQLPDSDFAVATCEIGIGATLLAKGKTVEAEKKLAQCISDLDAARDLKFNELLAVALRFHAQALAERKHYRDAEKQLLKSIEILAALGLEAELQLAYSESDLAGLYLLQNRITEAEIRITKAMRHLKGRITSENKEYVRADMIYSAARPMNTDSRLTTVSDAIQRMQYVYGQRHPNVARAVHRYFDVLRERGDTDRLHEAEKRFSSAI